MDFISKYNKNETFFPMAGKQDNFCNSLSMVVFFQEQLLNNPIHNDTEVLAKVSTFGANLKSAFHLT